MLSILIVNWNTRDLLRACLLSLRDACNGLEHEVIVVDNASGDGSAAMVRADFAEVHLVENRDNTGFAAANNQAYALASGDYIWLLNPDTEVLADAPQRLLNFLQEAVPSRGGPEYSGPPVGAVASALIDIHTRQPQRSCRTFPTPAALWTEASGLARFFPRSRRYGFYRMGWWNYRDARMVEQPMASSFLVRRRAIEAAGGLFDEQFPIFFNDVDLCRRIYDAGWSIWYYPCAHVLHHGGASTRQVRPEMIAASHLGLLRYYKKHYRHKISPLLYAVTMALVQVSGWMRQQVAARRNAS